MAIPAGYSRFVINGHLSAGEIFQIGFWSSQAPADADAANTAAAAVATAYGDQGAIGAPHSHLATGEGTDAVRCYSYPTGGPSASFVGVAPLVNSGTSTRVVPLQVAVVVTLLTGFSGRRNRGRIYTPWCLTTTAGALTTGNASDTASWWAGFLSKVNVATEPGHCVVLSQVAGSANDITSVRCDTRPDTQRRRADRQAGVSSVTVDLT